MPWRYGRAEEMGQSSNSVSCSPVAPWPLGCHSWPLWGHRRLTNLDTSGWLLSLASCFVDQGGLCCWLAAVNYLAISGWSEDTIRAQHFKRKWKAARLFPSPSQFVYHSLYPLANTHVPNNCCSFAVYCNVSELPPLKQLDYASQLTIMENGPRAALGWIVVFWMEISCIKYQFLILQWNRNPWSISSFPCLLWQYVEQTRSHHNVKLFRESEQEKGSLTNLCNSWQKPKINLDTSSDPSEFLIEVSLWDVRVSHILWRFLYSDLLI